MKYLTKRSFLLLPFSSSTPHAICSLALLVACSFQTLWASDLRSGLINPQAVQWCASTGKAYTVDSTRNLIFIFDPKSRSEKSVAVGSSPVSLAIDDKSGDAFVANAGDGTVSVIKGSTDTVSATLTVGPHPYSIAANSTTGKIYVSHTFNDQLTVIDGRTLQVDNISAGSSDLIAIDETKNAIYLLGYEGGSLKTLNGKFGQFTEVSVGMHAWGMTINSSNGELLIARPGADVLTILSSGSNIQRTIPVGSIPCSVAYSPRNKKIYVVNYDSGDVSIINADDKSVITTITVGSRPQALAVDPHTDRVYVVNTQSNNITEIDGNTNSVLRTLPAGKHPYAIAIDPGSATLHVANLDIRSHATIRLSDYPESQ